MARPLVGVLGGGQLGRMLGLAGIPLGLEFRFLDPAAAAPGAAVGSLRVASLGDEAAAAALADGCDVVTYEWEGVPVATARAAGTRAPVRPGLEPLGVAQDRLAEKTRLAHLDVAVAPFALVDDAAALPGAVERIGLPAVLKTRRGGYDGKGQRVLRSGDDLAGAFDALGGGPLLLEGLVAFERELSIVAVRGLDGETACYPLVETEHEEGILRVVRAPAPRVTAARQADAEAIARRLLDDLEYVGVLAVELFERDGELLANELAPRVHNSGHWTIEGADTSQFENHLRAVLGWPLGSTAARGHSAMVNAIGSLPDAAAV
ncbi:MAG TPA: 5-(carboxyamino)imidazole ribonucleotide synthase, partial [Acidimicrobiia bacterium]|nr:5-(carboxyamino)imidazole ribonucleotide synthase [Acidimicrobiia bacterium]